MLVNWVGQWALDTALPADLSRGWVVVIAMIVGMLWGWFVWDRAVAFFNAPRPASLWTRRGP